MRKIIMLTVALCCCIAASAQVRREVHHRCDSVKIFFHQGKTNLDMDLAGNAEALGRITDTLIAIQKQPDYTLRNMWFVGGASPEGNVLLNQMLSEGRASVLFDFLIEEGVMPDSAGRVNYLGRDWKGLLIRAKADHNVPSHHETVAEIESIVADILANGEDGDQSLKRLQRFKGGKPYKYMYKNIFPELRQSSLVIDYEVLGDTIVETPVAMPEVVEEVAAEVVDTIAAPVITCKPFYMGVKTNMLYDVAFIPNIGVEVYLGKNFTLGANWQYAWWNSAPKHKYWRTYGGDIELRRWFGSKANLKPMTGHHVGVYGGIITYDFELGGKGVLGDRWSYDFGLSYGYSLPIARRFNIDFNIGIGYLGGEYKEYVPQGLHHVWTATKQRHYIGPTKAEISLVWLIGCENFNRKANKH